MLDLVDKDFQAAVTNMVLNKRTEIMLKELKENITND